MQLILAVKKTSTFGKQKFKLSQIRKRIIDFQRTLSNSPEQAAGQLMKKEVKTARNKLIINIYYL